MPRLTAMLVTVALASLAGAGTAGAIKVSRLMAPPSACPHQSDAAAPAGVQEEAMRCMTNFARRHAGSGRLGDLRPLDRSAGEKARDILRCDSFSHEACGRDFTYWMRRVGYLPARCWRAGENIAWGAGSLGTVRSVFRGWMHSPGHRSNILGREFSRFGVGLAVGRLGIRRRAHVWVQHFGRHC
ncbi:MAG: CAP domain-containing protein [Solirubrobacterales bacterium]